MSDIIIDRLAKLRTNYPEHISEVRGKGLLIAIIFKSNDTAATVYSDCIENGLFVNLTQGNVIRLLPALNIKNQEVEEGLNILEKSIRDALKNNN